MAQTPTEFKRAPELERVVYKLVELFYPMLVDYELDFIVVMRSREFQGKTRTVATIEKLTGVKAWLFRQGDGEPRPVFKIEIVEPKFDLLEPGQKVALLHHELGHLEPSEIDDDIRVEPLHDVEEFNATARLFGTWHEGLEIFLENLEIGVESGSTRDEILRNILEDQPDLKL